MKKILLIGFPGTGKTTIGKLLSKKLNITFFDTDFMIEKKYSMPLHHVVNMYNVEFHIIEKNMLYSVMNEQKAVISPGGSIVYYPKLLEKLKKNKTIIIYLHTPFKILEKRLGDYTKRGILIKSGQTLYDLYCEREELYKKYADYTVSTVSIVLSVDKNKNNNNSKFEQEKNNIELCIKDIIRLCV